MRFENKVVIITGAASGIGAETARMFAGEGAHVIVADCSSHGLSTVDTIRQAGGSSLFIKTDVSSSTDVQAMVSVAVAEFGRVDVLFANAGVAADGQIESLADDSWSRTIDINLTGVFLCNKYVIKQMLLQGSGAIVNCGSIHSHVGKSGMTAYAAAKGGVKLLTKTLAVDYASRGIRVNAVCPGYIETPLLADMSIDDKARTVKLVPFGRLGTVKEVARAVMFLASEDASFITGASLLVDGGYTAQ